ncbi:MAG: hypothetical protein ACTHXA_06640 [Gulosibacter sp.]|uniref:hypothetical protein n=1 Tax=Gulosibacter sp. TaxID=2817531 RepID=UPI003F91A344
MTERDASRANGPLTLARGWGLGVVATVPAALFHGIAHGNTPEPIALGVAIVIAAAISVPLVGRKFTRVRSGAAIFASQALFHTFFAMAGTGSVTVSGDTSAHAHHHGSGHFDLTVASSGAVIGVDVWMLLAHLAAAVITVGCVWYGEALLRSLVHALGTAVTKIGEWGSVVDATRALPRVPRIRVDTALIRPLAARVFALVQGRGPPVLA